MATATVGQDHRSEDHSQKKESSPTSFLPSLKSFDIDTSKYKHYDHSQSTGPTRAVSDTSPSIDRLVLNHKPEKNASMRQSAPQTTAHSRSSSLSSAPEHPLKSPLEPPHGDVLRALSLPSDKPWPYSEDTLNELIRLRIEQEKTKHTQVKHELGQVVLELLREAQQHDISSDVIRRIFLNDSPHQYVHYLQSHLPMAGGHLQQPHLQPHQHHQPPPQPHHQQQQQQQPGQPQAPSLGAKRKNSTESVHTPGTENDSKPDSQAQSRASPRSEPKSATAPTSGAGTAVSGTSQSPQVPVVPQHLYPVYYTAYPDQSQVQGPQGPQAQPTSNPSNQQGPHNQAQGQSQGQGQNQPHHSKSTSQSDESENLGSPYSHKYPVVFQSSPLQYPRTPGSAQQPQRPPPPQTQPPQPYYYVNSSPQGVPGPLMPSQFLVPPPVGTVFPWGQAQAPAPEREDKPKRHKSNKNGINFMITTPKNPPAKKYNKS
ncbi:hypothetical protein FT663_00057 [Candidozyma haemuli var. vulneris]|uniref:Uncharacterized protein n=1 Tax=Candidozyma haemuli TaxID=45357 RepID=A0A2V1AYD6_9ASCO|nr:hypothetical protein CXQ85_000845 [[Candida] haemuloni]KAF3994037.1 hypothetical protein FT662_00223 [[Candida] haemuloni var. vulneris]KAF3995834.1 hypothetical protein FT663_00057 [[Candida] haemuloni var. vulneris]PVH21851.1 hypothetical protein CXQ85_000845 [[Candida] haemuloni]